MKTMNLARKAMVVLALCVPALANGQTINIEDSLHTSQTVSGDFSATFNYEAVAGNPNRGLFHVTLTNTSSVEQGGYITAFAFNNPSHIVDSVQMTNTMNGTFGNVLGNVPSSTGKQSFRRAISTGFSDDISAAPLGYYDIGASITKDWLGGGSALPGIGVGQTASFTFVLTSNDGGLDTLTTQDFTNALSGGASAGYPDGFLAVRFRGFKNGDSDQVTGQVRYDGNPPAVPEAGSMSMLLAGALPLAGFLRRSKKQ